MAAVEPRRVIADLRELDARTGGPGGARRVCWTAEWVAARGLAERAARGDRRRARGAGRGRNLWATLPGDREETRRGRLPPRLRPERRLAGRRARRDDRRSRCCAPPPSERRPPRVTLVDFADEEGARFGRSLFGSGAVAGTLDPAELADLRDADGRSHRRGARRARRGPGGRARGGARRDGLLAYLELHIEQGPVLDRERVAGRA